MTTPSREPASTSSGVASACAVSAFLPDTSSLFSPTVTTSAPSSWSRMTVTQYSRSSKPSASRTAIFLPSSFIQPPVFRFSVVCDRPKHRIDLAPGLVAAYLQGAHELWYSVGPPPGAQEPVRRLHV